MKVTKHLKTISIAVCLLLSASYFASAQTANSVEVKKAAKSVCNCLEKRGSKAKTQEEFQTIFQACTLDSAMNIFSAVMLRAGGDQAKANKLGQELGMQLAAEMLKQNCPAFMKMSMQMTGGATKADVVSSNTVKTEEITGTVQQVSEDEFLTITVKADNGREYKLYYLAYVKGSDGWLKNIATLKDKKVIVGYQEKEFYQPKAQTFVAVKEITSLELQ